MPRYSIEKVTVRKSLKPRREPYWSRIERGLYLGFRRIEGDAGTWVARWRDIDGKQRYSSLGYADVITYDDACIAAKAWRKQLDRGIGSDEIQTVADACRAYAEDRKRINGRSDESFYRTAIYRNKIGKIPLSRLRQRQIETWRDALGGGHANKNRYLAALRAALNYAVRMRYVDPARSIEWRSITAFKVNKRRELYLDRDQRAALVDALPDHAKPFVRALCLIPLRPGALAAALTRDYDSARAVLLITKDKRHAGRTVPLSQSCVELLNRETRNKLPAAPLIAYSDGSAWHKDRWKGPVKAAAKRADLPDGVVLYTLRHSVITDMIIGGMDTLTVAKIAGTSILMIQKHYGHLLYKHAADAMSRLEL